MDIRHMIPGWIRQRIPVDVRNLFSGRGDYPGDEPAAYSYLYIDKDITISIEEEAKAKLSQESDQGFLDPSGGIIKVPIERWNIAQHYERKTWMEKALSAQDDRNIDHARYFDGYKVLKHASFANAIELGCGPFTNTRLIAKVCKIETLTLLDPLIEDYLGHPNCSYNRGFLFVNRGVFRNLGKVPIRSLIPLPIEEIPPTHDKFDLVVIINVIEHCYDVKAVFVRIRSLLCKGGYLVFHDRYYDHANVAQDVKKKYDAGHPLKVDKVLIDSFLNSNFTPQFNRVETLGHSFMGMTYYHESIYFIGRLL